MADDQVTVKIVGDASAATPAIDQTRDSLIGLGSSTGGAQAGLAQVTAQFRQAGSEAVTSRYAFSAMAPAADQLKPPLDGAGNAAANTKAALTTLITEVGGVGKSFADGVSPITIFTQHGAGLVSAIAGMTAKGAGLVSFLGGPWGIAIGAAVSILGTLWAKHEDAAAAEEQHKQAADSLRESVERLNAASEKNNHNTSIGIQTDVGNAQKKREQEVQIRQQLAKQLQAAEQQLAQSYTLEPEAALGMMIVAKNQIAGIRRQMADNTKDLTDAQTALRTGQSQLGLRQAEAATNGARAATIQYEDALAALNLKFQDVRSKMAPEAFEAQAAALMRARDAALGRAQHTTGVPHVAPRIRTEQGSARSGDRVSADSGAAQADKALQEQAARDKQAAIEKQQNDEISAIDKTLAEKTEIAHKDIGLTRDTLAQKLHAIDDEERSGQAGAAKAAAQRAGVNRQLYQLDIEQEKREYDLKCEALKAELALENLKPEARAQIQRQIEELDAAHAARLEDMGAQNNQKIAKDARKAADAVSAEWKSVVTPIVSAWGNAMQGMITHSMTLRQAWQSIGQSMLKSLSGWVQKKVITWLTGEQEQTAATVGGAAARTGAEATAATTTTGISAMTALKQIAHSAAVAAARVYSAIAGIPYVGPYLAPIAAAAALYAVIRLGQSVFSAEGGMGAVPYDNAPFLLHKNEMVLPANLASPLRAMLQAGGAANGNAPAAANDANAGGFHYHDHSGTMTPAQIVANRAAVAKAIKLAHREGAFTGLSLAL
jgi:hypothetical protein